MPKTRRMLRQCSKVIAHSVDYAAGVFMKRNCYMVDESERVIAVYDGRKIAVPMPP